jgi:integrase
MHLDKVRVQHIYDVLTRVKEKGLASRTQRHVYFTAAAMFGAALERDLILASPCKIRRGKLPEKVDKDPRWRATAVHTREELDGMISDPRLPGWRRIFWALLFLAGVRFGEASARRWRDYQRNHEPLCKFVVNTSWNSQRNVEQATKTKVARDVPVHPVLAEILDVWRESGWERLMGRPPIEDDLIVPFGEADEFVRCRHRRRRFFGEHGDDQMMLKRFHKDLALLGARPRRQHDARRTFISLTVGDGASIEILNWVTHAPPKTVMGDYTSLVWKPLCSEVAKLQVEWRRGPAKRIAAVVNAAIFPASGPAEVTPGVTRSEGASEFAAYPALFDRMSKGARRGTRTPTSFDTRT